MMEDQDQTPIPTIRRPFLAWMLCEPDGTPSTRRCSFVTVAVFVMGIVAGAFYAKPILTPEIIDVLKTLLYATGGALAIGKFAEGTK